MAEYKTFQSIIKEQGGLDIGGFTDSITTSKRTLDAVAERNRGIFSRPELEEDTSGGFLDGMITWFAENGHNVSKDIDTTTVKDDTLKEYQNLKIRDDSFDVMSFTPQGVVLKIEEPDADQEKMDAKYIRINTNPPTADEVQPSVKKGLMTPNNEQTISVKDTEKVFGWVGRNEPSKEQLEAFNLLKNKAIEKGITGVELRQLLAQAAVESEWYTKTIERGEGSASNISGGSAYLGRGPLQITHDYNYKEFGKFKGVGDKYLKNPELLKEPELGVEAALWYWTTKVRPNVDDFSNTFAVSGAINRGDVKLKAKHLDWREAAFKNIEMK